jgi:hypothetical protein
MGVRFPALAFFVYDYVVRCCLRRVLDATQTRARDALARRWR